MSTGSKARPTILSSQSPSEDRPDKTCQAYDSMLPAVRKCRDIAAGWERVRSKGTEYLPRHPEELHENYSIRLRRPVFFAGMSKTLDGLVGLVFRRPPKLGEDVPEVIKGHMQNVDNSGTAFDVFLKEVYRDALEVGHSFIMVDAPAAKPRSLAEERSLRLRPYWIHYRAEDVRFWRFATENGITRLQQLIVRSDTTKPKGRFGADPVTHYTVYERRPVGKASAIGVSWERWEEEKETFTLVAEGVLGNQTEIPLAAVYGRKLGLMYSKPPLEDLADLNILQYQTNSDYYHAMHIADVPVPYTVGAGEENVIWGPNTMLRLPEGASAGWLETSGAALNHTRLALEDLKADMAVMGLSMLARDKRTPETATSKRISKAESDSALATSARSLEDAAELALQFHANYLKLDSGGSVEINRDYNDQQLAPERLRELREMVAAGELSVETMWQLLIEGDVLPPNFDPEVEKMRLDQAMSFAYDKGDA